jgi:hypothetical protein
MFMMLSAARTGTVLFSTTILSPAAMSAIIRAALSTYFRSAALPLPLPNIFVGVFTDMKMSSASSIACQASISAQIFYLR